MSLTDKYFINHSIDGWPVCKGDLIMGNHMIVEHLNEFAQRNKELEGAESTLENLKSARWFGGLKYCGFMRQWGVLILQPSNKDEPHKWAYGKTWGDAITEAISQANENT